MDPPKRFLEHYPGQEHAAYYGSVSNLDWNVGHLVEALRRNGILGDTLIIVTSDHAKAWGPRPGSYPGGMCTAYDEASRIPLILRYPSCCPRARCGDPGSAWWT
jgi:arylsulfatase A-like enzyme